MIGRIILAVIFGTVGTGIGFGVGSGFAFISNIVVGTGTGMCTTIDTAATQGLITPAQAEAIGKSFVQKASSQDQANGAMSLLGTDTSTAGEACKQFQKGLSQS